MPEWQARHSTSSEGSSAAPLSEHNRHPIVRTIWRMQTESQKARGRMNKRDFTLSPSYLKRFLAWPSGAIPAVLARCPSEELYYCGLGILIWFNSILAGNGMALMLSQTTGSVMTAIAGGTFWFLCILNLDRFLLLASYDNTGWKKLMPVSRVLLSLCLAIIIGEHVVQFIFHNEINNQLAQESLHARQLNYDKALQGFPEITTLYDEKRQKQAELETAKGEVARLRADYIGEAEGSTGSHVRGKGPLYEQKERDYKLALAEKQRLETDLQEIENRLDVKSHQLESTVTVANLAKDRDRGFLSYHRALFEIIKHDLTLFFLYIVISAAMILFEITPLVSKLGGKPRLHDYIAGREAELRKREEERGYGTQLRSLQTETDNEAEVAARIHRLMRETLDEVTDAVRKRNQASLSPDKAVLAQSLLAHVNGSILSHLVREETVNEAHVSGETLRPGLDPTNPASLTVTITGNEVEQPFTIVFSEAREFVTGSDLIYSLAGLSHQQRQRTGMRTPLSEYTATNELGELILPELPLFPQIGDSNTVYLSLSEPTVRHVQN
jgi:hypothetical protein